MKIGIVDDELNMRTQLETYVRRYGEENDLRLQTVLYPSGDALLADGAAEFDILIFDVDMPGRSGLETAREIRARDERVTILFVTNMAQYAINGYEVEAVDYIVKPIGYFDFAMKFSRAVRRAGQRRRRLLSLETIDGIVSVDLAEVLYVEVMAHYLSYHLADRELRVRGSMKEREQELKGFGFSRIHKSYLVNLARTDTIRSGEIVAGGVSLPLGRAYKDSFMEDYLRYLRG